MLEVESGDLTILKLVEILGPWLTNTDKIQRKQGTSLLASVLKLISTRLLEENECLFMVKFFCDRLQDHFTIAPYALEGLAALVSRWFQLNFELKYHLACISVYNYVMVL